MAAVCDRTDDQRDSRNERTPSCQFLFFFFIEKSQRISKFDSRYMIFGESRIKHGNYAMNGNDKGWSRGRFDDGISLYKIKAIDGGNGCPGRSSSLSIIGRELWTRVPYRSDVQKNNAEAIMPVEPKILSRL